MSLSSDPASVKQEADGLCRAGMTECQRGNLAAGLDLFDQSLTLRPDQPDVLHNRALILMNLGRVAEAIEGFEQVLKARPGFVDAWLHRGNLLMDMDRPQEAITSFDRVLSLQPDNIEALTNRSDVLSNLRRLEEAVAGYDRVIALMPDFAYAHANRGIALAMAKQFQEALDSFGRALALDPHLAHLHYERADALRELGRFDEALDACGKAQHMSEAWNARGNIELELRRYDDALASFEKALNLRSDYPEALSNRGAALLNLDRHAEAVASCDRSLLLLPGVAEAHNNRGTALLGLERFAEALADFDRALAINPLSAVTLSNRGNALQGLLRFEDAVTAYDRALGIDTGHAEVQNHRGHAMQQMDQLEEAVACYERALELRPDYPWVPGQALHNRMQLSDWSGFRDRVDGLVSRLRAGKKAATPFLLQSLIDAPDLHLQAADAYAAERYPEKADLPPLDLPPPHERIRIAYVSADFDEHPVTYLLAGMLEHHDRTRFETYAFGLRAGSGLWRDRVVGAVDHFIDVAGWTDADVTARIREMEIDIAVDLNGFTKDCRTGIFALRAAPVQVSYIGFLGTMGAPYIDYLIADPVIVPEEARAHYAEKIAYLPSYQMNDDRQTPSSHNFTRAELGLPEDGFVFSCFNLNYKITPDVFASWMRILQRVPDSVLWLYVKAPAAVRNLRAEAERLGVDSDRLIFAPRVPLADHQARQSAAGLFLDTHPYNAGATASSALRAGVPVLTMIGQSFAARMGASLLEAAGLPELITHTPEAYEDLAVALARDPDRLTALRHKLALNLSGCTLFDTTRSTRNIEAAYTAMHERARAGLVPDHIHVRDPR